MDLVSRLKEYILHIQMPVTQFADTANIPRPTFSQLLNGRNKKVSDELIGKIHAAFPELNIMWLLFGENEMLKKDANLSALNPPKTTEKTDNGDRTLLNYLPETERTTTQEQLPNQHHEKTHGLDANKNLFSDSPAGHTADEGASNAVNGNQKTMYGFDERYTSGNSVNMEPAINNMGPAVNDIFDLERMRPTSVHTEQAPGKEMTERAAGTYGISFGNDENEAVCSHNPTRKIVNIIVYYSDNSYESFTPDVAGEFIAPLTNKQQND